MRSIAVNRRLSLIFIVCGPLVTSCQRDPGPEGVVPALNTGVGDPNTQCANESAACFSLCGSPECAMPDNSIPPVLDVPVIWYQPGGSVNGYGSMAPGTSTADPCVTINDASLVIRQRSCAPCHGSSPPSAMLAHFTDVLDDMSLANRQDNEQDGKIMVIPGDPERSYVFQRIVTGLRGPGSMGMPPDPSTLQSYLGAATLKANPNIVVYPTSADVSVLYAWIFGCMPGADRYAYQASYGPGSFGAAANP
jgi:hypothetical protein